MKEQLPINYGNEFAKSFALKEAPSVLLKPMSRSQLALTRFGSDPRGQRRYSFSPDEEIDRF
jgi:hypothetical protein